MYSIETVAEEIYLSVLNDTATFNHKNIVVVGDNASGKTTLVKLLLEKVKKEECSACYFIDSLNRIVYGAEDRNQVTDIRYSDYSPLEILKERSLGTYLSKEDIFPKANKGSLVTYSELIGNKEKYENLFNKFFECKLDMGSILGKGSIIGGNEILTVNGRTINSLSSSEAAKIRIIMEIEYASACECKVVIIDEYDNSLDPDNQIKFMTQLMHNYPQLRFIFVIHNFALLVQLSEMDAVIYNNPDTAPIDINVIDCDDITAIGEVNRIRTKYIGIKDKDEIFLSNCVSECIKNGKIADEHKNILIEVDRGTLTMKNRILYDYLVGKLE